MFFLQFLKIWLIDFYFLILIIGVTFLPLLVFQNQEAIAQTSLYKPSVHNGILGPFIADPLVLGELDCPEVLPEAGAVAPCTGPLNFANLIRKQFDLVGIFMRPGVNPFLLKPAWLIRKTIECRFERAWHQRLRTS